MSAPRGLYRVVAYPWDLEIFDMAGVLQLRYRGGAPAKE